MKSFEYAGGKITLSIPSEWREQLEADEVRMYYQDIPQSGRFYVRVNTYSGSQQVNAEVVTELLLGIAAKSAPDKEHQITRLSDGNLMVGYLQFFLEDDPPIIMATWLVGIAVPSHHIQLASFSYTALARDAVTPVVKEELKLLEGCVHEAKYSVTGKKFKPPLKKAWWRRDK